MLSEHKRFTDIHSHIVFGTDDGDESLTEGLELLKLDRDEGARAVFATPHYGRENGFAPEASGVMRRFEMLKERAAVEVPEVQLYLGTEWYCAWTLADRVHRHEAFRMNGTDYVLAEFLEYDAVHESAKKIRENLLELKNRGFKPILAHPERYEAARQDWNLLKDLAEEGILLQVNAYDLDLNWNLATKELAQWLAREHLISFIGSDMHRVVKKPPKVWEGILWLYENTDEDYADAVCFGNAEKLLEVSSG